jgi:hypothetical protein
MYCLEHVESAKAMDLPLKKADLRSRQGRTVNQHVEMIDAEEHSRVEDATLRNLVCPKKDSSVPWCFKDSG